MSRTPPNKPARTTTEVGRRLTKREQTKVRDEHGLEFYYEALDHEVSMNLQRIEAQAAAVLEADGMQVEPIEFALERVRCDQRKDDSHDDDSLVGLAAQSLWNLHQLRLIERSYGKPDNRAMQHAYTLGRLSVLMRERKSTTQQTKDAAVKRVPGNIDTDYGKVTKESLVRDAIAAAGLDAGSEDAWTHLLGILERKGLEPRERGAKDERKIVCQALDGGDDIEFSFASFKSMVSRIKAGSGATTIRGRPKRK